jgi:hypothetical protein
MVKMAFVCELLNDLVRLYATEIVVFLMPSTEAIGSAAVLNDVSLRATLSYQQSYPLLLWNIGFLPVVLSGTLF